MPHLETITDGTDPEAGPPGCHKHQTEGQGGGLEHEASVSSRVAEITFSGSGRAPSRKKTLRPQDCNWSSIEKSLEDTEHLRSWGVGRSTPSGYPPCPRQKFSNKNFASSNAHGITE